MPKSLFTADLLFILEYQEPAGYDGAFSVWRRLSQDVFPSYAAAKAAKEREERGADYGCYRIYPIVPSGSVSISFTEHLERFRYGHPARRYQIHYRWHQEQYRFLGRVPDVENLEG